MSKNYYGSICFTDLMAKAKEGHKAFSKGTNGKIYVNVDLWINDNPDQYGNSASIKIDKETYIGNLKESKPKGIDTEKDLLDEETLPF